jgi:hypothetical protein
MVIRLFWYPGAYFEISGVQTQLWVLAGVMFVAGPVLSTFVYKPGKKGLALDLGILAGVELLAVVVATTLIFQRQPYFSVFAIDRFEALSRSEISADEAVYAEFGTRPGHTPRLVYAKLPDDPEALSQLIDETVFQGMADIDRRPEFWQPYASGLAEIKAAAKPLDKLISGTDEQRAIAQEWLAASGGQSQDYIFLPLRGKAGDATIILHAVIGFPVATLAVDPW